MKTFKVDVIEQELEKSPKVQHKIQEQSQEINDLRKTLTEVAKHQNVLDVEVDNSDNKIKFGVIGDTHFGSLYERIDFLRAYYQIAEQSGIETILHCGDILDGWKVYKGQEFELHARGFDEQMNWFQEQSETLPKIKTLFITGNHDISFRNIAGISVGKALQSVVPHWQFIGQDIADITFTTKSERPFKVSLLHPGGGTAYALSYRPQKIIEQLEGGNKPHLLCIGNFHKSEFIPQYRNVACLQCGCFQAQTPFMLTKGLSAHMGGWLMDITVGQYHKIKAEFISFF